MKIYIKLGIVICLSSMITSTVLAQNAAIDSARLKVYRATTQKVNELVHTKLDVRFDYKKSYLYGKAWLTLKPYAYATDSLTLDAKGMDINQLAIVKEGKNYPLKYTYDSVLLKISLDKTYLPKDAYIIYINYTSKPNELKAIGSQAITDAKGLYFINPDSAIKGKPVQIWTQGETESSSAWFPTIDKPNQKTTQEISMTVPAKYVTLSNGALVSQRKNTDGTRTDTWKMDKPHAPYLFMMAVGDFKIYHDKWNNVPVDYYLEPAFAPYAKEIFGLTPEMIGFYSRKLGIDYPWNKYAQIVVRDYVSGAMENTTATLHGDFVHQTPREMIDGSSGEEVIAHELFHQWFGDYVTAESWSNLSVNESFADFSETIWLEYKHGKDAGDEHNYESMMAYLKSAKAKEKNLIRFNYADKEDMFDVVTYQKGGRILNMLRNYLGEDVFYKGLNIYLTQNALGNGEAQQLRLALEKASGKDLNWFFNQWYYRSGNPDLKISYKWDAGSKTQTVYLAQTQKEEAFILPIKMDVYTDGKKESKMYWMDAKQDSISWKLPNKPNLVNVDADKILLVNKTDDKTLEEFYYQFTHAPLYLDRLEALNAATPKLANEFARKIVIAALNDSYKGLRIAAIHAVNMENEALKNEALPIIIKLAKTDVASTVKAAALESLASLADSTYLPIFEMALTSPSYAVESAALNGILPLDKQRAFALAKQFEKDSRGQLKATISTIYATVGDESNFDFVNKSFEEAGLQQKFDSSVAYGAILSKVTNKDDFNKGVMNLKEFTLVTKKYGILNFMLTVFDNIKKAKEEALKDASKANVDILKSQIQLVDTVINEVK